MKGILRMSDVQCNEREEKLSHLTQVIPEDGLERKLAQSRQKGIPLTVKLGFDPTAPDLHLGHGVVLKKLKEFQECGHTVCVIVGDFTARIGDPTGRNKTRPPLSADQIEANGETYLAQLDKILDVRRVTVRKNSEWLSSMRLEDVISLLSKVTLAQVMQRHDFSDRFKNHQSISLHEILYPLLQGQDSVAIQADIELGGTDQLFNCMMGKTLQESMGLPSQVVMCLPLLRGTDGICKMGKSLNNYIGLTEDPDIMYGKVMSIPDDLIEEYLELTTDFSKEQKEKLVEESRSHPMEVKQSIAFNIVSQYHSKSHAEEAQKAFYRNVQSKSWEDKDYREVFMKDLRGSSKDILSLVDLCERLIKDKSRSYIRKLISAGGVSMDGEKITVLETSITQTSGSLELKIGKRNFYKVIF